MTLPGYAQDNLPVQVDPTMLALLTGTADGGTLPKPFEKEIFLLETHIAGTTFTDAKALESELAEGDLLRFTRDAENEHDSLAIVIRNDHNHRLGFVPKAQNQILARLMDAGKLIYGSIKNKQRHDDWLKIDIRVYMRDL